MKSPVPNTMRRSVQLTKSWMSWTRRMWLTSRWPTSSTATLILSRQRCTRLTLRLRYLTSIRTKLNPKLIWLFRGKVMQTNHPRKVKRRRKENTQVKDQLCRNTGRLCSSRLKKLTLVWWSQIPRSIGSLFFTTQTLSRGCFIWSIKKLPWYGIFLPLIFIFQSADKLELDP